jgi:hypothetical protein
MNLPTRKRTYRTTLPVRHILFLLFALSGACGDGVTTPIDDDPGPNPPTGSSYDHARAPGASAGDLLSADDYDRMVVQVHYVEGFRPTDAGLQHLADFLATRVNKPNGIVLQIEAPLQITQQATYTTAEVRAIEQAHRSVYTEGTTLGVHLLFLNGAFDAQANVLGIAYNNTSMAIFEEQIEDHTGGALEPSQAIVEGTVANHEFGHILGLVANGSDMQVEHQDEPNGHHCDDPDCLMYYAVRTTDFLSNLLGGMPDLDANCLADLAANGGK